MNCEACQIAKQALTGLYRSGCTECQARMLANSPSFAESAQAEAITAGYRHALMNVFGEHWKTGHIRVKWWADHNELTASNKHGMIDACAQDSTGATTKLPGDATRALQEPHKA